MRFNHARHFSQSRQGGILRRLLVVLAFLTFASLIGWGVVYAFRTDGNAQIITRHPIKGEFLSDIVERGDVESSSNTELRCEVSSADGVRILEIVPEGTLVNPGDVVVQLDDSSILKDLNAQKIAVNTVEAALSKAKNELEAEQIALREYEQGTFVQEKLKLESERFVAEEMSRRAKNYYNHSRKLSVMGYITDTQLEGDRFQVDRFQKDLDVATTKLLVLENFTKPKTLIKHDSTIKTAKAAVSSDEAKYNIEIEKRTNLENQLLKCTIKATTTGQVVYHNPNRWRGDEFQIRKGNRVRERQVIVKLPDIGKMQVKTRIGEARVDRVKPGMEAVIKVEALRGDELKGTVKSISAYASDENWYNPNSKEYDAIVTIIDPPATLKPGMTSQVAIRVETQQDVLQIPVQCIKERGGKHYSVIRERSGKLALREVTIGSTNEKFIIIKEGMTLEDDVVMNPQPHLVKLGLKDVDPADEKSKSPGDSKSKEKATPIAGQATVKGAS